jgi:hypothetical protein
MAAERQLRSGKVAVASHPGSSDPDGGPRAVLGKKPHETQT